MEGRSMPINKYLEDSHLYDITFEVEDDEQSQKSSIWAFTHEDAQRRFREIRPHARYVQAW
jgi:hypothetical protein